MKPIRPRQLVHRGTVSASGFWIETPDARRRVLELWVPGTSVFQFDEAYLILLTEIREVACERAPGVPLVARGKVLLGAPLAQDELEALAPAPGSVVLVRGGQAYVFAAGELKPADPSAWLDFSDWSAVEVQPLGVRAPVAVLAAGPAAIDVRAALGGNRLDKPKELDAVMQALLQGVPAPTARQPSWLGRKLNSWLAAFAASGPEKPGRMPAGGSTGAASGGALPPMSPTAFQAGFFQKMQDWAARRVARSQLGQVVGTRQAQYVRDMMKMFQRGDLGDALRHAIPLASGKTESSGLLSLSLPTPRSDLPISSRPEQPARSMLGMTGDLFEELRKIYRQAFENLEKAGRIEDAAFILLELLHADEEGVEFLERHGRLKLAAEIAAARGLAAGLVVRLWFQAGDLARAIRFARRSGAFADAVLRLERKDPEKGKRLRLLWAETLAAAGDYTGAIEALWPAVELRGAADAWVDRAIEAGGPVGARMLNRKLSLFPDHFPEIRDQVLEMLQSTRESELETRQAYIRSLSEQPRSPQFALLGRVALRSMLRDAGLTGVAPAKDVLERLVERMGDAALRTDVRQLPLPERSSASLPASVLASLFATDVGTLAFQDVARLPNGRLLVALGEAGVRLFSAEGKTLAHFDQPAQRLILSSTGLHGIAAIRRGEAWRLARLDLASRRGAYWCLAALDDFATDFDGLVWFVSQGDTLLAIDPAAEGFEALWRVREENHGIQGIARNSQQLSCLVRSEKSAQIWTFEIPSLVMRARTALPVAPSPHIGIAANGKVSVLRRASAAEVGPPTGYKLNLILGTAVGPFTIFEDSQAAVQTPLLNGCWQAVQFNRGNAVEWKIAEAKDAASWSCLTLHGAKTSVGRLDGDRLILGDDRGRLLVWDCVQRRLSVDLRI